jgi:hypothetical protein
VIRFAAVSEWVKAIIAYVDESQRRCSHHGLSGGVFGYSAISALLSVQFGTAVASPVCDMVLAKQNSDEEHGVLRGGFALSSFPLDLAPETVYVSDLCGCRQS